MEPLYDNPSREIPGGSIDGQRRRTGKPDIYRIEIIKLFQISFETTEEVDLVNEEDSYPVIFLEHTDQVNEACVSL